MDIPASAPPPAADDPSTPVTTIAPSPVDATRRVPAPMPTVALFEMDFVDAPDVDTVADALLVTPLPAGRLPLLITPNVDHVVRLRRDPHPDFALASARAAYVLGDGAPIVAASRLLRRPLRTRLAGSELFPALWDRLIERNHPAFLVCPSERCASALEAQHPRALTLVPPMFDLDDATTVDRIARDVIDAAAEDPPAFLFIGISNPKQAVLAMRIAEGWDTEVGPVPLVCCLGASLEMQVGLKKKAPRWMARSGLEWAYRFAHEPTRLFRRYFVDDPRFLRIVWTEWRRHGRGDRG